MPSADTFSVPPIGDFVRRWIEGVGEIVDPFARNSMLGTITNDLNPDTAAQHHMDAEEFCRMLQDQGTQAGALLFDPPYSPRQIAECYESIGRRVTAQDTQNAALYARVRRAMAPILRPGGIALSFGWNSTGFGKAWPTEEILLVGHGGAHNDTICVAQRKPEGGDLFDA